MAEPPPPPIPARRVAAVLLSGLGLLATGYYWLERSRVATIPDDGQTAPETAATPSDRSHVPREGAAPRGQPGAPGNAGFHASWHPASPEARVAHHVEFQYGSLRHQTDTALSGMWLFLATELLFFGPLFLLYLNYRLAYPVGFALASARAEWLIGTVNTVLLLTSGAVFSFGLDRVRRGDNVRLFHACVATALLGLAFLGLKGYEWYLDLEKNLFPGPGFAITGPDAGGSGLFWSFYFVATGLHGLHMIVGILLVAWIGWNARANRYTPVWFTPVETVGLYWSFVDMVWLVLYPAIYLAGRITS